MVKMNQRANWTHKTRSDDSYHSYVAIQLYVAHDYNCPLGLFITDTGN